MTESVVVYEKEVMCDGAASNETPSHPRIYLHIQNDERVECPYCGKMFIYDNSH